MSAEVGYWTAVVLCVFSWSTVTWLLIGVVVHRLVTRQPVRWGMSRQRADMIVLKWVEEARRGMQPGAAWDACQQEIGALIHSRFGPSNSTAAINAIWRAYGLHMADELDAMGLPGLARLWRDRDAASSERDR